MDNAEGRLEIRRRIGVLLARTAGFDEENPDGPWARIPLEPWMVGFAILMKCWANYGLPLRMGQEVEFAVLAAFERLLDAEDSKC